MRQIFVDSRDRTSGTSCDFSIMLPQTLALSGGHQGRIDDLRIPVTVPTISTGNNLIWTRMGAQDYESTIPTGQYESGAALAQAIQQALSNVPGAWTVVYDPRNLTLGFACSNGYSFIGGNWMEKLLARPHHYNGSSGYLFSYVPLQGLDVCYLCCPQFSHLDSVGPKGASDCLCSVPITAGFGSVQAYSMSSSVFFDLPAITTQQLTFQLRDRDYKILSLVPNISFTLTID